MYVCANKHTCMLTCIFAHTHICKHTTRSQYCSSCFAGDKCTSKIANVRGLLVLSLVCLLLCPVKLNV